MYKTCYAGSKSGNCGTATKEFRIQNSLWHMALGCFIYLILSVLQILLGLNRSLQDLTDFEVFVCGLFDLSSGAVCNYAQIFGLYYSFRLVRVVSVKSENNNVRCTWCLRTRPCVTFSVIVAALLGSLPLISLSSNGSVAVSSTYGMCIFDAGTLFVLDSTFSAFLLAIASTILLVVAGCLFRRLVGSSSSLSKKLYLQLIAPVAQLMAYIPLIGLLCIQLASVDSESNVAAAMRSLSLQTKYANIIFVIMKKY
jgi:hypothetical protein